MKMDIKIAEEKNVTLIKYQCDFFFGSGETRLTDT